MPQSYKEAILIIQKAIDTAKSTLPTSNSNGWILPDRIFLETITFLAEMDQLLQDTLSKKDKLLSNYIDHYINRSNIGSSVKKELFSPFQAQSYRSSVEAIPTFLKTVMLYNVSLCFTQQNEAVKQLLNSDRIDTDDVAKYVSETLPIWIVRCRQMISVELNQTPYYSKAKEILNKSAYYALKQHIFASGNSKKINSKKIKEAFNNSLEGCILQKLLVLLKTDVSFLEVIENNLELSTILLINCFMRALGRRSSDQSMLQENFMEEIDRLKQVPSAVRDILGSTVSCEIKRHLLDFSFKEVLKIQKEYPIGFLYYLNGVNKHSVNDFKYLDAFVQLLQSHECFLAEWIQNPAPKQYRVNEKRKKECSPKFWVNPEEVLRILLTSPNNSLFHGCHKKLDQKKEEKSNVPSLFRLAATTSMRFLQEAHNNRQDIQPTYQPIETQNASHESNRLPIRTLP